MIAQAQLFSDHLTLESPSTEGIKYAGSKLKLIPHILNLARKVNAQTVLDGFSGTTRVSQAFAQCGYDVVCNDHAVWSEVLGTCYLKGKAQREYLALIEHLNALAPKMDGSRSSMVVTRISKSSQSDLGRFITLENWMRFVRRSRDFLLIWLRSAWHLRA